MAELIVITVVVSVLTLLVAHILRQLREMGRSEARVEGEYERNSLKIRGFATGPLGELVFLLAVVVGLIIFLMRLVQ